MKQRIKQALSVLLAAFCVLAAIPFAVAAPTLPPVPLSDADVALAIGNGTLSPGNDTVTLTVRLTKNPGLTHLAVQIEAPAGFSLTKKTYIGPFATDGAAAPGALTPNPYTLILSENTDKNNFSLGALYELTYTADWSMIATGDNTFRLALVGDDEGDFRGADEKVYTKYAFTDGAVTVSDPGAPRSPNVSVFSDTSVKLAVIAGAEYKCGADGIWQGSPLFEHLTPATTYAFYARYRDPVSTASRVFFTTKPPCPTVVATTVSSVTVAEVTGAEYKLAGGKWQQTPVFEGLSPATTYTVYLRMKNSSGSWSQSDGLTVSTDKADAPAPSAPTAAKVLDVSVLLTAVSGAEYSMDGNTWQASPFFDGLTPSTPYVFYLRTAETAAEKASPASEPLAVTTLAPIARILGDADGDGDIDFSDRVLFARWLAEWDVEGVRLENLDLDGDGDVSNTDRVILARYLADWPGDYTRIGQDSRLPAPPTPTSLEASFVSDVVVRLAPIDGAVYSMDGLRWQEDPLFGSLAAETEYTFFAHIPATAETAASGSVTVTVTTAPPRIKGDADGVEGVSNADRALLARWLAGWDEEEAEPIEIINCDLDDDGRVDFIDRVILARYLAGWDGYEKYFE